MADSLVIVVFGVEKISLKSPYPVPQFETSALDCRCYKTDDDLNRVLAKERPVAIVSIGESHEKFPNLVQAPSFIRQMWTHFKPDENPDVIGSNAFHCFLCNAMEFGRPVPLVSVITTSYKTGDKILRPFHSLLAQTHADWEWVVLDDSDDGDETFDRLSEIAKMDYRVRVYKESRHSGSIGNVKRTAFDLARGDFLVELDHDDQLTPQCLEWLVSGYAQHPEVGFIYTDFAECYEGGAPVKYEPGWGLGYGTYREEMHNGMKYSVVNCPHINAKTIRHIVAAPNHVRSWRTQVYRTIGGHGPKIHVADDYELMVRTFLATRMGHIPKMAYVQYRNKDGNTSQTRNQEIQRLVRYLSIQYDGRIHERLLELDVDDFVWNPSQQPSFFRLGMQKQSTESHCTVTIEV